MARLTLFGFYNYDNTLFDDIVLPDGINKEYVINEIMKRGDLYTYHQALDMLKFNIKCWFSQKSYDFEMMFAALRAEYNPIENYDRKEATSRTHSQNSEDSIIRSNSKSGSDVTTGSNTANTSANLTRSEQLRDNSSNVESVSAYNAADFQNANKSDLTKSATTSSQDDTLSNAKSDSRAKTDYGSFVNERETNNHGSSFNESEEVRVHGNIGITTNQQMIESEMLMRSRFNIYEVIAAQFEREFLIQVY